MWLKLILFAEMWETPSDILYERQLRMGARSGATRTAASAAFDARASASRHGACARAVAPARRRRRGAISWTTRSRALAPRSPPPATTTTSASATPRARNRRRRVTPENKCRHRRADPRERDARRTRVAGLYLASTRPTTRGTDPTRRSIRHRHVRVRPGGRNISEVQHVRVRRPATSTLTRLHEALPVRRPLRACSRPSRTALDRRSAAKTCVLGGDRAELQRPDPTNAGNFHR